MVRGLGGTACRWMTRLQSDAGAVQLLIDQPRRIHMMEICGYLVLGTGGVVGS
jgi:hypothetical protein